MARPGIVPRYVLTQDLPFLVLITLFLGFVVLRNGTISRLEGSGLLALFIGYITFIFIRA